MECFFFNDTATTEIYTLSLHDALPISHRADTAHRQRWLQHHAGGRVRARGRSEEHTSELQSLAYLVCRLLLEKKKAFLPTGGSLPTRHSQRRRSFRRSPSIPRRLRLPV